VNPAHEVVGDGEGTNGLLPKFEPAIQGSEVHDGLAEG
jgi:hypothetical protein